MAEARFRPFPQIPRYPAEHATPTAGSVEAEEALEGAPVDAPSSAFLSIPKLAETASLAVGYAEAKSDVRRRTVDRCAADFIVHPENFTTTEDALAMLEESGGYPAAEHLHADLGKGLDRARPQGAPTPEVAQQWLTLLVESPLYSPAAEKMLTRFVERCKTTQDMTEFMYQLALGGFSSSNPDVVQRTMEIIGLQTPVLRPESPQAALHILAMFDRDDATLKKAMEIDGAFFYLATQRAPELLERITASQEIILAQPGYAEQQMAVVNADTERFKKISAHYNRPTEKGGTLAYQTGEKVDLFPLNLIVRDAGPLRQLLNEAMAHDIQQSHADGVVAVLDLPSSMGARKGDMLSELGKIVHAGVHETRTEVARMETPNHLRTLSYLVPETADHIEQWNEVADANQQLRREMIDNSRYLLSPRGDQVEVADPVLRALGFNNITYTMNPTNRRETIVTIAVGNNCEYRALLDEYFSLRDVNTHNGIQLPRHGAFLENVLLSHLREIRCSERVNEVASGGPTVPGETRRAFTSRRAHRRILPEGQSPTQQQIVRILGEYDIDLVRLNRERAASGENRRVTYVYEVENIAVAGVGPVRSRTPEATRRLQELLTQRPVAEVEPETTPEE